ncbi:GDSL-type esterase/lipase family protein [Flavobacteriaceae bacterium]|jgi:lysophospholipase L1-like esterase|nr:GDSL-type esterase/lipase family protein [Flavobacteriaceae bacterium]
MKWLLILLLPFISFTQNLNNTNSLYPNENIFIKYQDKWGRNNYKKVVKEFKKYPLNKGDIVFLGNSITAGGNDWSIRLSYPNIRNRGIGGDVTEGVLHRLDEITYYEPKAVFLLIGINDLWNTSPFEPSVDYISKNIIRITQEIKKKSPKTKVFVQTILPVEKPIYRIPINEINNFLKSEESKNSYSIIDLHSVFVDDKGLIIEDFFSDGIHLTEQGYNNWVKIIRPIVQSVK